MRGAQEKTFGGRSKSKNIRFLPAVIAEPLFVRRIAGAKIDAGDADFPQVFDHFQKQERARRMRPKRWVVCGEGGMKGVRVAFPGPKCAGLISDV